MTKKFLFALLVVFTSCVLASCASKAKTEADSSKTNIDTFSYKSNGAVDAELVAVPEGSRYRITPGVTFANPEPEILNALPEYPAHLLSRRLDSIEVITRLIVNAEGLAESATVTHNSSQEQAFADATLTAVKTWRFKPLKRTSNQVTEALPFTQEYRFIFRQLDGRAIVQSGARQ